MKKHRVFSLFLAFATALSLVVIPASAQGDGPAASININGQDYTTWSTTVKSYLMENENGGLTRVEYINGQIVVEDYSSDFTFQSSRTIPMELSMWGGFFAGSEFNFFVFGQENLSDDDGVEVIRVVKYSKDWQRLGQASLYGANTYLPFEAGSLRMDEYNGYLYIRTCHEMYTTSDGYNHQANMTIAVRQSDMTITDSTYQVMNPSYGYVSHSFNQFILVDQQGLIVTLDHGDAYPRAMTFMRYYSNAGTGTFSGSSYGAWCSVGLQCPFAGEIGDNTTGASVGGLAETSQCYMMAYNYDGQGGSGPRNVYLQAMDISTGKGKDYQITQTGDSTTPVLAPTGLDGGYLLWNNREGYTAGDTLYYLHYGADGVPEQYQTATGSLSDCAPIYYNGQVVWYVTNNSTPVFYTLDSNGVTAHPTASSTQQPEKPDQQQPSGSHTFSDVPASNWAYASIQRAAEQGWMNGVGGGRFNPTGTLSCYEFFTLLGRAFYPEETAQLAAANPDEPWWYAPCTAAYQHGVLDGTDAGAFMDVYGTWSLQSLSPAITRADMALVMANLMKDQGFSVSQAEKADAQARIGNWSSIDTRYQDAVSSVYALGIIIGTSQGTFAPQLSMTRAEAATVLCRLSDAITSGT